MTKIASADLEPIIKGLWSIHPSKGKTFLGVERFRRRPMRYLVFDGPGWCLYETGWRRRFKHAGVSRGVWRTVDLEGQALLMFIVQSYRPSDLPEVLLESNYGYSGGFAVVKGAHASRETEDLKMRGGEARMYFTPVRFRSDEVIVALPSDGRLTPLQRWARVLS